MKRLLPGIILLFFISVLSIGCKNESQTGLTGMPSGKNCAENVAYLQSGVNKYFQAFGNYPTDVNQLAEAAGGKGPFVAGIPKCPSGNRYVVANGKIVETH